MLISERQHDQAAGLRRITKPSPVRVIAVASGKGGVGKTNVSANLAVALANMGKDVMLLDADLGLANIDVMLGLHPTYNLSHVLTGVRSLEEIIVPGPVPGLRIIPAASGIQAMAELGPLQHAGIVNAFSEITHKLDVLLIDTAAGISDSVVSFTRAAQEVIMVVCDEPASITDAYALIKLLSREHGCSRIHILANMVHGAHEGRDLFAKVSRVTDRFLDVVLTYMGAVPYDDYLRKAVQKQQAIVQAYPRSKASLAFKGLAQKIVSWPAPQQATGGMEFFLERMVQALPTVAAAAQEAGVEEARP